MSNNSILLIDPNFDPVNSRNLSLLVKIGADTFSYTIIDKAKKLVYAVYDEQECEAGYEKFNERLEHDTYLQLAYKEVKVAIHTSNVIFVPQTLFNSADVTIYTKYFTETDSPNVYVQPALTYDLNLVFSIPAAVEKTAEQRWPNSVKIPHNAGLLLLVSGLKSDSVIIDFTVGSFQLLYLKDGNLAFMQSYQFEGTDELSYYLLLIINQLHINLSQTELKVCGIVHRADEKWNCVSQYFNYVDFLSVETALDTSILDDMPNHYYTSLLALDLCE